MGASMRLAFRFTLFYPNKQKRAERHIQVTFLVSHKQKFPKEEKSYGGNFLAMDEIFSSLQIRNVKTLHKQKGSVFRAISLVSSMIIKSTSTSHSKKKKEKEKKSPGINGLKM